MKWFKHYTKSMTDAKIEKLIMKYGIEGYGIYFACPKMINNNVKQIEHKQDYYSILGYCRMKNIELSFSDAIHYGKEATRISKEKNIDIRKISDEIFGFANSYSVNVLDKVFEL